ncbi:MULTISPECIES: GMC family oxidoreductase [Bacillaceae]|uniref:GMC family oxidoreductase n=1 Tax=Bacillus infantis NRRL B-14911 TaxID=1367477 RepID=U5L4P7_9BACI|nr:MULTISPECIES: GMC family oxidoreductase [Bacillus]AGX02649.1 GMC family oxidoreductase [Bacillus infantis NRRL B-14911]EAR64371.1 putative oxidoreductase subunit [Bacillus sp. NRRL B-14911]MCA1035585.1 GMC family oxidoreductase [Bacillus infantis]MCK6208198.1 GMC family oxidoreductase [Bacillus infantis]MDW2878262.1 GMC family oxidoreductase [Bacillus infantis]
MAKTLPKTDVVVVGVGWAGGIISAELAKQGMKVVGLERGKERGVKDYYVVHDELRYAIRYELMQDLSKETLTFRNTAKERALPMRQLGSFLLGEGLGGSGVHWNGHTFRFLPYDFEIKSQTVAKYGENKIKGLQVQDWGITYDELEPYYDTFEKTAGIGGEENPFGGKRSNPYPNPPMKETPLTKRFKDAAKNLGMKPYHMPSANMSQAYENQYGAKMAACQYCAFCERFGCEYGAKADPTVSVIPYAKDTGNFELRTYSNVTEVLHDGTKATGVRYVDVLTKEEFIQPADIVVLTSYVMNNARLLLSSNLGRPYNPETGQGVIGKNYCYQILPGSTGFFDEEQFNTFMGAGALGASVDDYNGDNFDHSEVDFIHGGSISLNQSGKRPIQTNPVPQDTPRWGKEFKQQSVKYYTRHLNIGTQGASMPTQYNYLDLDPSYKDAFGLPLLRLTYDFTQQDKNLYNYIGKITDNIMKEMGANLVNDRSPLEHYDIVPYQTTHNTGGVIMGAEPETSAVNNYLQMWDAENVFVVGASAFAHNGGYNPTGTVGAFAYRAAEGIIKYSKQGGALV